jgi:hypothetical protein
MDLLDIRTRLDERYANTSTDLAELALNLEEMEFVRGHRIRDGVLEVMYDHIILQSHDGTQSLDLGRLVVKITPNRTFKVVLDSTSERDAHLTTDRIHPHVSHGDVCVGNGVELEESLKDNGDIAMFVVLMHNFLLQYSNGSPYWRPFIFDPCRVCSHDFNCVFCKCHTCSYRRDEHHDCSTCRDAGCLSARSITNAIVSRVTTIRDDGKMDNDQLIELYDIIDKFEE